MTKNLKIRLKTDPKRSKPAYPPPRSSRHYWEDRVSKSIKNRRRRRKWLEVYQMPIQNRSKSIKNLLKINSTKNRSKWVLGGVWGGIPKNDRFLIPNFPPKSTKRVPKWSQNRSKVGQKQHHFVDFVFDRYIDPFRSQNDDIFGSFLINLIRMNNHENIKHAHFKNH